MDLKFLKICMQRLGGKHCSGKRDKRCDMKPVKVRRTEFEYSNEVARGVLANQLTSVGRASKMAVVSSKIAVR